MSFLADASLTSGMAPPAWRPPPVFPNACCSRVTIEGTGTHVTWAHASPSVAVLWAGLKLRTNTLTECCPSRMPTDSKQHSERKHNPRQTEQKGRTCNADKKDRTTVSFSPVGHSLGSLFPRWLSFFTLLQGGGSRCGGTRDLLSHTPVYGENTSGQIN